MEQIKILEIIKRGGYLNTEQIALLLNKEVGAADGLLRALIDKKIIRVDQLTRKNIYMLSSLGNRKLGKKSKSIRINYNELQHQDLLIKGLCQQKDILSYQTEKELKAEGHLIKDVGGNTKSKQGYPDLIVHYESKEIIVELERTRKSKKQFKLKLNNLRSYLLQDIHILGLVPNESMLKFVKEQIINYKGKSYFHNIEIITNN